MISKERNVVYVQQSAESCSGQNKKGWPIGSGEVECPHRYIPQERLISSLCFFNTACSALLGLLHQNLRIFLETFAKVLHPGCHPEITVIAIKNIFVPFIKAHSVTEKASTS